MAGQESGPVIRINVNLVQVDAVVTGPKGVPVRDLQAADFEILQDGKPQTITNFSYVSTGRSAAPQPGQLARADVRRTIALVVDDLSLTFEQVAYTRNALREFVDRQMQAGDLVAVLRTSGGSGALERFTADPRVLRAAIDRIHYRPYGSPGAPRMEQAGAEPESGESARRELVAVGAMGTVDYVLRGMRGYPGRKSLVLLTTSLAVGTMPDTSTGTSSQPSMFWFTRTNTLVPAAGLPYRVV